MVTEIETEQMYSRNFLKYKKDSRGTETKKEDFVYEYSECKRRAENIYHPFWRE